MPLSSEGYEYFIDMSHPNYRVISITFIPIEPYEYIIQVAFESITELMSLIGSNIDIENINIFLKEKRFKELEDIFLCISVICHNPVMFAITSLSNNFSPKYLLFNL